MDNIHLLHIWGWHSELGLKVIIRGLVAQDLDGSQEGRGGGAGRDLKTIGDSYEQLHANKFGKLSERDNLADVK